MDEVTPTDASIAPSHRRGEPPERSPCEVILCTPKWNGRGSDQATQATPLG
jgi:hypothetical protein